MPGGGSGHRSVWRNWTHSSGVHHAAKAILGE